MTFRIWKSSGLINHLFFSSLFLLTPLFFEHQEILSVPLVAPRTPLMPPLPLRHQFPPHSFDSHHLRLAFAPLRVCSSHPCFGFEPSALRVRRRSVTSLPQKPGTQNAPHVFASLFRAQWLEPSLTASLSPHAVINSGIGCSWASVGTCLRHLPPSPLPSPSSGKH